MLASEQVEEDYHRKRMAGIAEIFATDFDRIDLPAGLDSLHGYLLINQVYHDDQKEKDVLWN